MKLAIFHEDINLIEFIDPLLQHKVDLVVVTIHWGSEYIPVPSKYVRSWAKKLKQFGVHIIIGGHPHVIQGHECLGKSLVTYSMGNFLFHTFGISTAQVRRNSFRIEHLKFTWYFDPVIQQQNAAPKKTVLVCIQKSKSF